VNRRARLEIDDSHHAHADDASAGPRKYARFR
jgi:hypothetical protein